MSRRDSYLSPRSRTCRFDNRQEVILDSRIVIAACYSLATPACAITIARRASLSGLGYEGTSCPSTGISGNRAHFAAFRGRPSALLVITWRSNSGDDGKCRWSVRVQRCGLLAVCKDRIDLATNSRARRKQRLAVNVAREQCLARALTLHCSGRAPASRHPPLSSSVERPLCRTSSGSSGAETHIG